MKKTVFVFLLVVVFLIGIVGCNKQTEIKVFNKFEENTSNKQAEIKVYNEFEENTSIQSFVLMPKSIREIEAEECGPLGLIELIEPNLVEKNNLSGQAFRYVLPTETVTDEPAASIFISLSHANGGWYDGYCFEGIRTAELSSISFSLSEEEGTVLAALEYENGTTQVKKGRMYYIT